MPEVVDVSDLLQRYRLVLRSIWNEFFWLDPGLRVWDSVDRFEALKPQLFQSLIVDSIAERGCCQAGESESFDLLVVPAIPSTAGPKVAFLKVLESTTGGDVWSNETRVTDGELEMKFIDFFDWALLSCRDLRFIRVRIMNWTGKPEYVGRDGLVDVNEVACVARWK